MVLKPDHKLQVANKPNATGTMQQPVAINTDVYSTLIAYTGLEKDGLLFEQNTGNLILAPVPIWQDLTLADWSFSRPEPTDVGGKWKEVTDRALAVKAISQYDATKDREWTAESNTAILEGGSFCVKMQIGPPPKNADHDWVNYYRFLLFPADAKAGETQFRLAFHYGEAPRLEISTDGGSFFKHVGDVPSNVDLGALRSGKNIEVTATFLYLEEENGESRILLCWIGDLNRFTTYHRFNDDEPAPKPGTLGIAGKNGIFSLAYAPLRFKRIGYYSSQPHYAPKFFKTQTPKFVVQPGTPRNVTGLAVKGRVESLDLDRKEFTYRLTLEAPPLDAPLQEYSAITPLVKQVTVVWPPRWNPPPTAGWQDVQGVLKIQESQSFDLETGLLKSGMIVTLDNNRGQRRLQGGVQAYRLWLGYQHAGLFPRMTGLANTNFEMTADEGVSTFSSQADDLLYILQRQPIWDDIYPSRWCVYALARLLLQHGQIVPDLMLRIPACEYGPDPPNCPHTKFPAHPGWKTPRQVISCLSEVREVLAAWWGQDQTGQFRFEPFVWQPRRRPVKTFKEGATNAFGYSGGAVDELLGGTTRRRSLDRVVNDINLVGFEQSTGRVFLEHYDDTSTLRSKFDPSSPNYLGFTAPLLHVSSLFSTKEFAQFSAVKLANRVSLPGETALLNVMGQPALYPGDIVAANERRTIGFNIPYWVTDLASTWTSGAYFTTIGAFWTGIGAPPGSV